jgi:alpha-tubulin suppressor-like RCC1 family protein
VWAWGTNSSGQVGDGTTTQRVTPVLLSGLSNTVQLAAGLNHSLALDGAGRVRGWGHNAYGQVGDGTSGTNRLTPTLVPALTEVVSLAAGHNHSLAVRSDGSVWAWGANTYGQLGNGTTTSSLVPVQVQGLTGVVSVAAGEQHSLALRGDGAVLAWGLGVTLGTGSSSWSSVPVLVPGLGQGVTRVAAGVRHSIALRTDGAPTGRVWTWGLNSVGQLGDGTTFNRAPPVAGRRGVSSVSAANNQVHVLTPVGEVWAAGTLLGDGDTHPRSVPVRLSSVTPLVSIAGGSAHDLALDPEGRVWSWGTTSAALGDGGVARQAPVLLPAPVLSSGAWALGDADGDGLANWVEVQLESDVLEADTNDDGLTDGAAFSAGVSVTAHDSDADGLANGRERELGTDPLRADSDGDGVADGSDAFPLDPTLSAGSGQPGDTTPPTVTLVEPTQAVPLP